MKLADPIDLLLLEEWEHCELVDGRFVEIEADAEASAVACQLIYELVSWSGSRSDFQVFGVRTSYRCFLEHPDQVLRPDGTVVAGRKWGGGRLPEGHLPFPPDVAFEVISPNDTASYLRRKVEEYLEAGVRLVWVLDPETRTIEVRGLQRPPQFLYVDDELTGDDVLPGFSCSVAALFAPVRR